MQQSIEWYQKRVTGPTSSSREEPTKTISRTESKIIQSCTTTSEKHKNSLSLVNILIKLNKILGICSCRADGITNNIGELIEFTNRNEIKILLPEGKQIGRKSKIKN